MITVPVFLVLVFVVSSSAYAGSAYSDHGSGAGGGCSGDCTPPTLGENNAGQRYVSGGFGINGHFIDVEDFQQDVATQTVTAGDPVEVRIRVYENEGPTRLAHVGMALGLETQTINGIRVDTHPVQINWANSFDRSTSFEVDAKDGLVADVSVSDGLVEDTFGYSDSLTEVVFTFTPMQPFDTSTIMVEVWDYDRNSWANYFYDALLITGHDKMPAPRLGDVRVYNTADDVLEIPGWFKLNAQLWSKSKIDDATFVQGIKYCIDNGIMNIPNLPEYEPDTVLPFVDPRKGPQYYIDRYYGEPVYREWFDAAYPNHTIEEAVGMAEDPAIPSWIKNNADLWANDAISDSDFVTGIEYLVKNGIVRI